VVDFVHCHRELSVSSIPASRATAPSFAQLVMWQMSPHGDSVPPALSTRTLRRGQHLYWPGDTPTHVYSIHRGALKTYRISPDSSEWISGFHFPGEVLGLDAVIERPVRGGAVALSATTVCLIPVPMLVDSLGRSGAMRLQLLGRFGDEIARLEEQLSLDALSAERRLATFILWVANKLSDGSEQPTLSLPMSHKELGNYLRLVPETVSRLLARFYERGWVSVRRRELIVHHLEQLRRAAGGESLDEPLATSVPVKRRSAETARPALNARDERQPASANSR